VKCSSMMSITLRAPIESTDTVSDAAPCRWLVLARPAFSLEAVRPLLPVPLLLLGPCVARIPRGGIGHSQCPCPIGSRGLSPVLMPSYEFSLEGCGGLSVRCTGLPSAKAALSNSASQEKTDLLVQGFRNGWCKSGRSTEGGTLSGVGAVV
jgi:hypothetical protein